MNSSIKENKGKIVFRSKTPKKITRLVILSLLDTACLTGMIAALILFVNILIYLEIPNSILPSMIYFLGSICMGFFFYTFTMLILLEFWTYLLIYEKGVEILLISIIPFKFKRKFVSYENIIDVKVEIDDFNLETLFVYAKNKDPYELDEFDLVNLNEVKDLILKNKIKYLNSKKF